VQRRGGGTSHRAGGWPRRGRDRARWLHRAQLAVPAVSLPAAPVQPAQVAQLAGEALRRAPPGGRRGNRLLGLRLAVAGDAGTRIHRAVQARRAPAAGVLRRLRQLLLRAPVSSCVPARARREAADTRALPAACRSHLPAVARSHGTARRNLALAGGRLPVAGRGDARGAGCRFFHFRHAAGRARPRGNPMNRTAVLVTGGAGYVGSHAVLKLVEAGYEVTVLDDLSTGSADSVIGADLVVGDIGDRALVTRLIRERRIETVMHLAAKTVVPESVADQLGYYDVNTSRTRDLLQCCVDNGVENFVFSSTAAVYGIPATGVASENTPTRPINLYGASKLMCERMLADVAAATDMRYVVLRYFNVAGSDTAGRIGQSKEHCTLLTKVACEAALGVREVLEVYGTDYDTPDGTGVRDYIHVEDIADAHIAALRHLQGGGRSLTLNCGYGHGYSVREVIA